MLQNKLYKPKTHVFLVEQGSEPTPEQRAQVQPGDTVVIRFYPKGFLDMV